MSTPGQYSNSNTVIGDRALQYQIENGFGNDNTAIGYKALKELDTGSNESTAVGSNALAENTIGENTAVGAYAAARCTGTHNTALGNWALRFILGGSDNAAFGYKAMAGDDNSDKNPTIAANGKYNTAIGSGAMRYSPDGDHNTAVGFRALHNIDGIDARYNTAIGSRALINLKGTQLGKGTANVAVGSDSGKCITSGSFNTMVGTNAGENVKKGDNNTFLGHNADIGNDASASTAKFRTAIGSEAKVEQDDSIILGRTNTPVLDKVGIRTRRPDAALNVLSGNASDMAIHAITAGAGPAIRANTTASGPAIEAISNNGGNAIQAMATGNGVALSTQGGHRYKVVVFSAINSLLGTTDTYTVGVNDHVIIFTAPAPISLATPGFALLPVTPINGQIYTIRNASTFAVTITTSSPAAAIIIPFGSSSPTFMDIIPVPSYDARTYIAVNGLYYRIS